MQVQAARSAGSRAGKDVLSNGAFRKMLKEIFVGLDFKIVPGQDRIAIAFVKMVSSGE